MNGGLDEMLGGPKDAQMCCNIDGENCLNVCIEERMDGWACRPTSVKTKLPIGALRR